MTPRYHVCAPRKHFWQRLHLGDRAYCAEHGRTWEVMERTRVYADSAVPGIFRSRSFLAWAEVTAPTREPKSG